MSEFGKLRGSKGEDAEVALDLVCALLAVNLWTIEKAFSLKERLEHEGLVDLDRVAAMSQDEVLKRLERAGCHRGDYITGLLSHRLVEMAKAMANGGIHRLDELIRQRRIEELDQWLLGIRGVGPHVLRNFKILRGIR